MMRRLVLPQRTNLSSHLHPTHLNALSSRDIRFKNLILHILDRYSVIPQKATVYIAS